MAVPAVHGRRARVVPLGGWRQVEELMAGGKEGRTVRLRKIVYSLASLVALAAAIGAAWKN